MAAILKQTSRSVAPFVGELPQVIPTTPPAITREIREALGGTGTGAPPSQDNPFITDDDTRLADAEAAGKALRKLIFRKQNIFTEIRARKRAALGIRTTSPLQGVL